MRQGRGKYKWPDGSIYVGVHRKDQRQDPRGEMQWPDGTKFAG